MLVAGVIGAVVLSAMSDRQGKRVRYLVLTLALAIPSLVGVAFVSTTWLLYLSSAALGFFIVGALPIGMQYAAEVTFPTPEGTSNGLVQLFGQCSVVFVYVMGVLRTERRLVRGLAGAHERVARGERRRRLAAARPFGHGSAAKAPVRRPRRGGAGRGPRGAGCAAPAGGGRLEAVARTSDLGGSA